ncbi:alpha-amylase family glycosyl hydrolase [Rubritalea tangerina]|uniref:alpha-amylase family glycosyl hydrolase n=1 Tax=Rubritalea tangerina TaxID=430798 RepID=UPI003617B078
MRVSIYQLFVRHFSNTREQQVVDGTIEQNGCGKFAEITEKALREIQSMGFTHIWFTGVLEQASSTCYPGIEADEAVLMKGKAGSPYAIRDYFDVCADYAVDPENRIEEFSDLLDRCHELGIKTLIDFVPNHVARSYHSDIQPDLNFGESDDVGRFFAWNNNFFYLAGDGVMELPGGEFSGEGAGRVTGNNAATWQPSLSDWYETVKLNYGHDYTTGRDTHCLPEAEAHLDEVPDTWVKMDAILSYWQELGVDGFRCDMAHMVPMEFWAWVIRRARLRDSHCYFMAEAYDGDPAKLTHENVLESLLKQGFDTVYDGDSYELVKEVVEHGRGVTELDALLWAPDRLNRMLRYAENHDEVRLASRHHWRGQGASLGKVVMAFLTGVGPSPYMLYNGQEVGECGDGVEGFAGDDGRSSIFDYGHLPRLAKWVNEWHYDGGKLAVEEHALRAWYVEWCQLLQEPAFARGGVYGLNSANMENSTYRAGGEAIAQSVYAFVRHDRESDEAFLVVLNFSEAACGDEIEVWLPEGLGVWMDAELAPRVLLGGLEGYGVAVVQLTL